MCSVAAPGKLCFRFGKFQSRNLPLLDRTLSPQIRQQILQLGRTERISEVKTDSDRGENVDDEQCRWLQSGAVQRHSDFITEIQRMISSPVAQIYFGVNS